jgi:hypothetical protein
MEGFEMYKSGPGAAGQPKRDVLNERARNSSHENQAIILRYEII